MKRNDISVLAAACLAGTLAATPAAEAAGANDKITARMTPGQIAGIMRQVGYTASVDIDGEDDPIIIAGSDDTKFGVVFFGCEKAGALPDRYCGNMEFLAIFEVDAKLPLAKLNKWNAEQAFGKTYQSENGDVALSMPINLAHGVSESFIVSSLEWWQSALAAFKGHMK